MSFGNPVKTTLAYVHSDQLSRLQLIFVSLVVKKRWTLLTWRKNVKTEMATFYLEQRLAHNYSWRSWPMITSFSNGNQLYDRGRESKIWFPFNLFLCSKTARFHLTLDEETLVKAVFWKTFFHRISWCKTQFILFFSYSFPTKTISSTPILININIFIFPNHDFSSVNIFVPTTKMIDWDGNYGPLTIEMDVALAVCLLCSYQIFHLWLCACPMLVYY
jgi:hypothetical protein